MINNKCGRSLAKQFNLYGNPQCTELPSVLMISPTLIMVSPSVLNDIPQCTEHPLVYCTDFMQGVNSIESEVHVKNAFAPGTSNN